MGITNNNVKILVIENSDTLKNLFEDELFADWNFDYVNNVRQAGKFISKHDYNVVILNTDLSKRENIYFLDLLINTIEEKPFLIISDIGENDLCFNIASECSDAYFNRNQITPEKLHTKLKELQRTNNVFPEEFHLKNLVDLANYGIGIIDLAGKIVYINKYFAEIHGYKPEEIIGKNVEIFHTQEQLKRVKKINSDLKKNFKYGPLEVWHKTKTGHEFPMLMTGIAIKDNKNNVKYISATAIDISENIEIQENLKESEKKFRLIFEHSEDAIFWANFDTGIIINCNKKAEKLLEMDRNELIGKSHTILHPPEIREDVHNSFSKMEMQKDNVISERYLFSKSGKRIPVRISSTIIKADNEKIIQGVFHNISELKSKEEELKKSQELYKLIAENTGDGVILTENGVIKYASPSFEKISGYNSSDFINKPVSYLFNFIHKDDVANVIDTIQTDLEQNEKVSRAKQRIYMDRKFSQA
jgi:PAS domain S-box-containing protein